MAAGRGIYPCALDAIEVELYADGRNGDKPAQQQMKRVRQLVGAVGGYTYSVHNGFNARIAFVPKYATCIKIIILWPEITR